MKKIKRILSVLLLPVLLIGGGTVSASESRLPYDRYIAEQVGEAQTFEGFAVLMEAESEERVVTLTLTVGEILPTAAPVTGLDAELHFDAERLELLTGSHANGSLDCVTAMPEGWGEDDNLTEVDKHDPSILHLCISRTNEEALPVTEAGQLTFTLRFRLKDGCEEAGFYIPHRTVRSIDETGSLGENQKGRGGFLVVRTYCPGDVNGDGTMNMVDYLLVKRHWLETLSEELTEQQLARADYDQNGVVNATDYYLMKKDYLSD